MERRVKERLVGATILVVLVVLIVPELLSGPKRAAVAPPQTVLPGTTEPIRSVTVDLATNKTTADTGEAASAATADGATAGGAPGGAMPADAAPGGGAPGNGMPDGNAAASGTDAAPAAAAPKTARGAASPAVTLLPPQAPAPTQAPAPHPGWGAQLGSFAARDNAEKLERQLRSQGFAPYLTATGSGRALRYRVRVGPVADRAAAERLRVKLKNAGHIASVVTP